MATTAPAPAPARIAPIPFRGVEILLHVPSQADAAHLPRFQQRVFARLLRLDALLEPRINESFKTDARAVNNALIRLNTTLKLVHVTLLGRDEREKCRILRSMLAVPRFRRKHIALAFGEGTPDRITFDMETCAVLDALREIVRDGPRPAAKRGADVAGANVQTTKKARGEQ